MAIKPSSLFGALLAAGLPLAAAPAWAQLIDVGTLPGGTTCSGVVVNNGGTVAGTCDDADGHFIAFRRLPGGELEPLASIVPGKSCGVMDMNNADVISGNCEDANGEQRPVRWRADGTMQILTPRPGLLGLFADVAATAGSINQNGAIAGTSSESDGTTHGVVWLGGQTVPQGLPMGGLLGIGAAGCRPVDLNDEVPGANAGPVVAGTCALQDGQTVRAVAVRWQRNAGGAYFITGLGPVNANGNCSAIDINISRQIAGTCTDANGDAQAVLWNAASQVAQSIEGDAGTTQSTAAAINAGGLIAGTYRTADGFGHAFLWNPNNGNFFDIAPLPGGFGSVAVDLNNDNNTVVGQSEVAGGAAHGFRWRLATGTVDLGTLGGFTSRVSDISDNGRIVGTSQVADGHGHAFFTDP